MFKQKVKINKNNYTVQEKKLIFYTILIISKVIPNYAGVMTYKIYLKLLVFELIKGWGLLNKLIDSNLNLC